ncbi:MAG: hypothetical protein QXT74_05030, partial [Candidatus Nezhaarchaeales archaeon]
MGGLLSRELSDLLEEARAARPARRRGSVAFYAPSFLPLESKRLGAPPAFPSFSITGEWCALNCDHCRALLLKGMEPATTP